MTAQPRPPDAPRGLALGLDGGGTHTRWALVDMAGAIVAEGEAAGFSAWEIHGPGRGRVEDLLAQLAADVRRTGEPLRAHAGLTGLGDGRDDLTELLARQLGLPPERVTLGSDIETAYLDLLAPGQGYLVYAGTGSVAAFIDAEGALHRAGGRGGLLDDGGSGYWIAREALRRIWRNEDERPGCWRDSPMAAEVLAAVGGPDWDATRTFVYAGQRGAIGRLALAVARCADRDPVALAILRGAGEELARLGRALLGRYGPRPIVLSGRAATVHPCIAEAMRAGLPEGTPFTQRECLGHHAAARLAARGGVPAPQRED